MYGAAKMMVAAGPDRRKERKWSNKDWCRNVAGAGTRCTPPLTCRDGAETGLRRGMLMIRRSPLVVEHGRLVGVLELTNSSAPGGDLQNSQRF